MTWRCATAAILFILFADAAWTEEARTPPSPTCVPTARYTMPDGVELSPQGDPGVAPADLPESRTGFEVPPVVKFNLALNPTPAFNQSQLDLGQVAIDRKTGVTTIDGQQIGGGDPCLPVPKETKKAEREGAGKPEKP